MLYSGMPGMRETESDHHDGNERSPQVGRMRWRPCTCPPLDIDTTWLKGQEVMDLGVSLQCTY